MTVRTNTTTTDQNNAPYTLVADCTAGNHAVSGGAISASSNDYLGGSYPATSAAGAAAAAAATNPRYWAVHWSTTSSSSQERSAFALCVPN